MNKKNNIALVPKLRFPEFLANGDWANDHLGRLSLILRGGSPRPIDDFITNEANGLNWLKIGDVSKEAKFITQTTNKVKKTALTKTREVNPGDLIMSNSMSFGRPYILKIKTCIHDGWIAVTEIKDFIISDYLYYFILSGGSQVYFSNAAAGGGIKNLNAEIIKLLLITFPSKTEQQKIADFLSSIDALITAENEKFEALKAHKKGLMQKLFPFEGKAVPELRFSEFRGSGKWEKKLVEDFFLVGSSKRVLQENWTTQGIPFYRTRELVSLSKNEQFSSEIFISEKLFCEITKKYGVPSEGDFLISGVGTLGISYQVQTGDKFYFKDGNVLWFKLKTGLYSTYFKYCFESDYIQNQIIKQTSISTVGTYTIQNAKRTKLWYPPNNKEQLLIADCLSAADDLITAQAEKIEALKAHKKGLMQGLFPSIEEVVE